MYILLRRLVDFCIQYSHYNYTRVTPVSALSSVGLAATQLPQSRCTCGRASTETKLQSGIVGSLDEDVSSLICSEKSHFFGKYCPIRTSHFVPLAASCRIMLNLSNPDTCIRDRSGLYVSPFRETNAIYQGTFSCRRFASRWLQFYKLGEWTCSITAFTSHHAATGSSFLIL